MERRSASALNQSASSIDRRDHQYLEVPTAKAAEVRRERIRWSVREVASHADLRGR